MKLQAPFVQLPVTFDAGRLAAEIAALGEDGWLPHPSGYAGNDFLPLVAAYGEPANEAFEGPMRPTPLLDRCPYLKQVLSTLGCTLGRTRLMRLSGQAEVTPHVDVNYYWRERMRVHVPIVTQPTVRFICGPAEINMKAGECWIFDTWSLHRVINDAVEPRIHLVADTIGGDGFWDLLSGCRSATHPSPPGWTATLVEPSDEPVPPLDFEAINVPVVMTPWEARDHLGFLYNELAANQPAAGAAFAATSRFLHVWAGLWARYGEDREGWPRYREALDRLQADLRKGRAETLALRNGPAFVTVVTNLVIDPALADHERVYADGERRDDPARTRAYARPAKAPPLPTEPDPLFDRPIFVVNPPRSGSSVLFETLSQAPGLFTIGGESHGLIEGIPELSMGARKWSSNRLEAADADPAVVDELRWRFRNALHDRDGRLPGEGRIRMLEKTPKNALRVPFLARAFPEARFVYLHRDPREVMASMMEAWESGRFSTYGSVPGWKHRLNWSLLLTPGWRDLAGLPLNEVVAGQWAATTRTLLDDLDALPADRRYIARYDAFVANPETEIRRLARAVDVEWDRTLGESVPLSGHTVSAPAAGKWKKREKEIEAVLPGLKDLIERAEAAARA